MIDATHDAARRSWVASANGHSEFPIQNLPLGVFSPQGGAARGGVAIGDAVFDLAAALEANLFSGSARDAAEAAAGPALNSLLEMGAAPRAALRARVSELLDAQGADHAKVLPRMLHQAAECTMHLPVSIGAYTDFFAGIHHATAGGRINRPENPLMPNYKYVPVAYHSRASSVRPSGGHVLRPNGQRKQPNELAPRFGPCRNLDYELELGVWVGPGNELGKPILIADAAKHIAGFCLLNDWSARDIQSWEAAPLGPFLGKSFCTFVSPWIITPEAMEPFRTAQPSRPDGDPATLPHLWDTVDQASGALDLEFEAFLLTTSMRDAGAAAHRLSRVGGDILYWTVAQMVTHHTSNGCNLQSGDVFGSGTLSGTEPGTAGCLLESTFGGRDTFMLPNGETRRYLEDGDEVIFRAHAHRSGFASLGFGECRGRVMPAMRYQ
jgi:fumarylacetoacetase